MAPNTRSRDLSSSKIVGEKRKEIKEIYYDGYFYDVTDWINRHPGGRRIIGFYTEAGEEATEAIQQFHFRSMSKVTGIMRSLKRRPASLNNNVTELDPQNKRNRALTQDFLELHRDLVSEGYFDPSISHVIYRITEILILLVVGLYLVNGENYFKKSIGILIIGLFCGRCGWIQHEGGHMSLCGNKRIDNLIQTIFFGLGLGLSSSWWTKQHSMHHSMPQRIERDVDLETLPLLAFNEKILKSRGRNFFIRNQAFLFITIDTMLVALFWKFYLHPRHLIIYKRRFETLILLVHFAFFLSTIGIWPYFLATWVGSIYLFGNFSLSHTHLPVTQGQLHWVEYALLHTQDIESKWWPGLCDWWMGMLNCQIEHHLFPTMPQFRNTKVKERVKLLAQKYDIPYLSTCYWEAVKSTFKNLHGVAVVQE